MVNAREFTNRLADLLRNERAAMADFLVALAEFDGLALWRELGHASLFSFLRRELGLSAGAAQYRKTAAELFRRYPPVAAALRSGQLCLSSVIELAKVLTPENGDELIPRFFGLSSRDAAVVAASIRPVEDPPRRDVVTELSPLPARAPHREDPLPIEPRGTEQTSPAPQIALAPFRAPETELTALMSPPRSATPARPVPPTIAEPLDADSARLHLTVSRRFLAKVEAVKSALSHSRPGASTADAIEACMDLLLAQHAKRRGLVEKPRTNPRPSYSEAIPAAVKRAAWLRAGGRCEWPLEGGGVCGSTLRLEFDHRRPRALGGPSTLDNIAVHCRVHNQGAARAVFGDAMMDRYTRRGRAAGP